MNIDLSMPVIIYHRVDWDGLGSAAVASILIDSMTYGRGTNYWNSHCFPYNYNDGDEYLSEEVIKKLHDSSVIFILDVTIPDKYMKQFKDKIVFIDHHLAKDVEVIKKGYFMDAHIDTTGKIGAVELTYDWFDMRYSDHSLNSFIRTVVVQWLSAYDVFNKEDHPWDAVYNFQLGLKSIPFSLKSARQLLGWDFVDDPMYNIQKIKEYGSIVRKTINNQENRAFKLHITYDEDGVAWNGILMVTADSTSMFCEQTLKSGIDFILMANFQGTEYKMSIRIPEESHLDANKMAKHFKGGGHIKAAGFGMSLSDFNRLCETLKLKSYEDKKS